MGLRDFRHVATDSPYLGTCAFCACYYAWTSVCMIDGGWTPLMSRCALSGDPRINWWFSMSAHERAELLCVKIPTYERGLHYFHHLPLTDKEL